MAIQSDVHIQTTNSPYINILNIEKISSIDEALHCGVGLFYQISTNTLETIFPHLNKKFQTIAQYGYTKEEMKKTLEHFMPEGVDRVVQIGNSLDFSNIWDGYDLFRNFTREIEIN
jgi:hypothetical protein